MANTKRRIGVFLAQPESQYQTHIISGISAEAYRLNMDVLVFSTYLKSGGPDDFKDGEKNIYRLPNADTLDAVAVLPDTIQIEHARDMIFDGILKDYKKPVVIVDDEVDGYDSVMCDDKMDIEAIIEHLISVHGCKDIAFVTGPEWHSHAQKRLKAFRKKMAEHNMAVDENEVYYGDFWYFCGESIANKLMSLPKLPDAVACASDPMAVSIIASLKAGGIRVPEDILVTGYDCDGGGIRNVHTVTSIQRRDFNTGVNTVRKLYEKLTGEVIPPETESCPDLFLTHTCGCRTEKELEKVDTYVYRSTYDNNDGFNSGYNFMVENVIGALDFEDCLWKVNWFTGYLDNISGIGFCFIDGWEGANSDTSGDYRKIGYTENVTLAYEKQGDVGKVDFSRVFPTSELYPALHEEGRAPATYYFTPMHFGDRCFGYCVLILDVPRQTINSVYSQWMRNVNNAVESLRRRTNLECLYKQMEKNAIWDISTGVMNKNGFSVYSARLLANARKENKRFTLIIGDLNCLKYINDEFGHIAGDEALMTVGNAFNSSAKDLEDVMNFRIGGDEFVQILVGNMSDDEVTAHLEKIRRFFGDYNAKSGLKYPVLLGMGCYSAVPGSGETVESILDLADKQMFEDKRAVKKETGFDYKRDD